MEYIIVYKVICDGCQKPFFEFDTGLPDCPYCHKDTHHVICNKELKVYGIKVNACTGQLTIHGLDA